MGLLKHLGSCEGLEDCEEKVSQKEAYVKYLENPVISDDLAKSMNAEMDVSYYFHSFRIIR